LTSSETLVVVKIGAVTSVGGVVVGGVVVGGVVVGGVVVGGVVVGGVVVGGVVVGGVVVGVVVSLEFKCALTWDEPLVANAVPLMARAKTAAVVTAAVRNANINTLSSRSAFPIPSPCTSPSPPECHINFVNRNVIVES
jgi:hypothetical protein